MFVGSQARSVVTSPMITPAVRRYNKDDSNWPGNCRPKIEYKVVNKFGI